MGYEPLHHVHVLSMCMSLVEINNLIDSIYHVSFSSLSIGVLLLNACLTVVASQANSHKDKVII